MANLNHARHAHKGRATVQAFVSSRQKAINRFTPAKAATAGRSLSADEIAAYALRFGATAGAR